MSFVFGVLRIITIAFCIFQIVKSIIKCFTLYREYKAKSYKARNWIKRLIERKALKIFLYSIAVVVSFVLIKVQKNEIKVAENTEQFTIQEELMGGRKDFFEKELSKVLANEYFAPEIKNLEENLWEHFMLNEIGFSNYNVWSEESESIIELRNKYLDNITNGSVFASADLKEICKHIENFYGTPFIPYTTRTLEEVSDEIRENVNASPELYAEELYLRSLVCDEGTFEVIYQLGRAADDAFKQSVNWNKTDDKQLIFFASITLAAYQLSLCKYEEDVTDTNVDIPLIYYRMAEIYLYLDKHHFVTDEYISYEKHFKLSAEAYLARARLEYDPAGEKSDMNADYPYYDDYYAELLSYVIKQFDKSSAIETAEDKIIKEFFLHALTYKNSSYGKEANKINCHNLILMMDNYLKDNYNVKYDWQSLSDEI